MRISFWFLASLTVSGCYLSHERPLEADAGLLSDASSDEPDFGIYVSPETPPSTTVARNSCSIRLAEFDCVVDSGFISVSMVGMERVGVGAASDFANVFLYDVETGERFTVGRSINSMTNAVTFPHLNIEVSPERPRSFVLVGDLHTAITGDQHAFGVTGVNYEISPTESGSLVVIGGPMLANTITIGSIDAGRIVSLQGDDLPDLASGSEGEISNFWLAADDHRIEVRSLLLLQQGSISDTEITDLRLYHGSDEIARAPALIGDQIIFRMTVPFQLLAGSTENFTIRARVGGSAGRTIRTYIEYPADIEAVDTVLGTPAFVELGSFDGTTPENASTVTVR